MLTRIRSAYLRNEKKYDRWGGLGKVLVTVEVLRSEGIEAGDITLHDLVNAAFPRTFSCQKVPDGGEALPEREELQREVDSMARLLGEWGVPPPRAAALAMEEVAERRGLDAGFLTEYLK